MFYFIREVSFVNQINILDFFRGGKIKFGSSWHSSYENHLFFHYFFRTRKFFTWKLEPVKLTSITLNAELKRICELNLLLEASIDTIKKSPIYILVGETAVLGNPEPWL